MANGRPNRRWGKGTDRKSVATFKPVALGSVLEPTRSSRAQRRVHGGAAVETKRSGLKIPDDELSSEIKNSAKIMIIYNTVLRYIGVTPALLRGKLDNDATSTDTAGHDSFRSIKASSTRLVA